jgi:hypothetical protein
MKAAVKPTFTDPVLQERLAKYLVQRCFRNSVLEDLHAGIAPSSKTGDYSDVMVCTPFGDIAWDRLSRFDDAEKSTFVTERPPQAARTNAVRRSARRVLGR